MKSDREMLAAEPAAVLDVAAGKGSPAPVVPASATGFGVCMTALSFGSMRTRGPSVVLDAKAQLVFLAGVVPKARVAAGLAFTIQ